ncbi:hypothetical protein Hypma_000896 [Hypsizygus marmoreus]|uniref:Uncharacterized protein n=1 Tax=Hypsizygus marmoreus TaxID=39966 RepID=A0A369J817_HYPMA|nr:hypothetical protein Hypma_000896 [Hypsizygus marmoreus]
MVAASAEHVDQWVLILPHKPPTMVKSHIAQDGIDDILLGLFGAVVPHSHRLDHAVRFFGTWSGSDKLMMLAQYAVKLLAPLMQLRAEVQFRAGKREKPLSPTTDGLNKFAGQLGLARRVSGFWGILAILKGLSALERHRPKSRFQLNLQRLQGISMLFYYPLDYLAFFSSPLAPLLPGVSPQTSAKATLWSIRSWGVYVFLQTVQLLGEWKEVAQKELALKKAPEHDANWNVEAAAAGKRKQAVCYQLAANISRLPVILHWSVVGGLYKNEHWSTVLSFISAVAAIRGGWETHRVPPPHGP